MAMYAMGTMPLIHRLQDRNPTLHQVWFADDSAGTSDNAKMRQGSDLQRFGHSFGFYVNPSPWSLILKLQHYDLALEVFEGTGVHVSSKKRPYLGAGLETEVFVDDFVKSRVNEWMSELSVLCKIAQSQPHAAFAALSHTVFSLINNRHKALTIGFYFTDNMFRTLTLKI